MLQIFSLVAIVGISHVSSGPVDVDLNHTSKSKDAGEDFKVFDELDAKQMNLTDDARVKRTLGSLFGKGGEDLKKTISGVFGKGREEPQKAEGEKNDVGQNIFKSLFGKGEEEAQNAEGENTLKIVAGVLAGALAAMKLIILKVAAVALIANRDQIATTVFGNQSATTIPSIDYQ